MKSKPWALIAAKLRQLSGREQLLVGLAALLLLLALLRWVLIGPAWNSLQQLPAQRLQLQGQLLRLQALQAEARALQAIAPLPHSDARAQVVALLQQHLGAAATTQWQGDSATVQLQAVPGQALSELLAELRGAARIRFGASRLQQAPAAAGLGVSWNGSLSLQLAEQP